MFTKGITNLYNELRNLTEKVKNYYVYHAMLIIFDSIIIFISNVTILTLNYTNEIDSSIYHSNLFMVYCFLKMLLLFFIVRETQKTVQEVIDYTFYGLLVLQQYYNINILKAFQNIINYILL
jgi:hypothetical protein